MAAFEIIRHLDKKRFGARVVMPQESRFTAFLRAHGIDARIIPHAGEWEPFKKALQFFLRANDIRVVHLINTRAFEFNSALAAKLLGIPVIWHMHFRFDAAFPSVNIARRRQFFGLMQSLSWRIVACSAYARAQFSAVGLRKNILLIPNALARERFRRFSSRQRALLRKDLAIEPDAFLVAMVSRVTPQKRPLDFLRTAALVRRRYPSARFLLVGSDTTKAYWRKIRAAAAGKVVLAGFREDIPRIMHALDALLFPAVNDTAGLVVLEAMAAGKPVVAADSGGIREIVRPGKTGILVPPGNPARYAQALIRLIEHPRLAQRMGKRGTSRVKRSFSMLRTVKKWEELYRRATTGYRR